MRRKKYLQISCLCLIAAATFLGLYKTVFYGYDIDESYGISMAYRMVRGDHLFKEMWEPHQTSALFILPFIYLYRIVNGSAIGIVVFLRIVGVSIQFIFAFFLYRSFGLYISKTKSFVLSAIFFNFAPKYLHIPEFCFLAYLFMVSLIAACLAYWKSKKRVWIVVTGISLAGCVLAYPQVILGIPFIIPLMYLCISLTACGKGKTKPFLVLLLTLALCGIAYLGVVFKNVSISELVRNIPLILSDPSHQSTLKDSVLSKLYELKELVGPTVYFLVLMELILLFTPKRDRGNKPGFQLLCICLPFLSMIPWIIKFIHGYHGVRHLELSYMIYAYLIGGLYILLRGFHAGKRNSYIFCLFAAVMVICISCSMASNLNLYSNGGLYLPGVLLLLFCLLKEEGEEKLLGKSLHFLIAVMCCIFLIGNVVLVRMTSVEGKYIFDDFVKAEVGTCKNIKLPAREQQTYTANCLFLMDTISSEDMVLFVGTDIYMYYFNGEKIGAPSTISTPGYDGSFLQYYELYPEKLPNIIVFNKYYKSISEFREIEGMEEWLQAAYDLNNVIDTDYLQVIVRK